jgi:hypothetical protein
MDLSKNPQLSFTGSVSDVSGVPAGEHLDGWPLVEHEFLMDLDALCDP